MKLNKFAYLCSKPLGNHTLKIMKKIPGNLLKNLEKSWKYHGILSVRKSGNPATVFIQKAILGTLYTEHDLKLKTLLTFITGLLKNVTNLMASVAYMLLRYCMI